MKRFKVVIQKAICWPFDAMHRVTCKDQDCPWDKQWKKERWNDAKA